MLDGILKTLGAIEKIASTIAAVFMFAIMIIVFGDVIMRYAFNRPFSWAYDLISLYLMAGCSSWCFRKPIPAAPTSASISCSRSSRRR